MVFRFIDLSPHRRCVPRASPEIRRPVVGDVPDLVIGKGSVFRHHSRGDGFQGRGISVPKRSRPIPTALIREAISAFSPGATAHRSCRRDHRFGGDGGSVGRRRDRRLHLGGDAPAAVRGFSQTEHGVVSVLPGVGPQDPRHVAGRSVQRVARRDEPQPCAKVAERVQDPGLEAGTLTLRDPAARWVRIRDGFRLSWTCTAFLPRPASFLKQGWSGSPRLNLIDRRSEFRCPGRRRVHLLSRCAHERPIVRDLPLKPADPPVVSGLRPKVRKVVT